MKLADLKAKGAFVDKTPVKKTVTCTLKGEELKFDVFVVRQPFGVVEAALNDTQDRRHAAQLISLSIRLGEKAEEAMTYEDAYNLDPALAWAFVKAINEVNAKN